MTEQTRRLRIIFGKRGALQYIGHLDLAKIWERVLRRARIGLTYSQGFIARPKMQLASPLPLGITSECEILDVWLAEDIPVEGLAERLQAVSPEGLPIYSVFEVPVRSPALQTLVESATYVIAPKATAPEGLADLAQRIAALLAQPAIIRTRRDKAYDLRPLVRSLALNERGQLVAALAVTEQGTGRPDELLDALGLDPLTTSIHRVRITLRPPQDC